MNQFILNGNWIDFIILIIIAFYIAEEWIKGFVQGIIELVAVIVSLFFALKLYSEAGLLLVQSFSLSRGIANAVGFLIIAFIVEFLALLFIHFVHRYIPQKQINQKINEVFGFVPALISGVILVAFLLTILVALPIRPNIKKDINDSQIGGYLIQKTTGLEKVFSEVFGQAVNETLTFLTIRPDSEETVDLHFKTNNFTVDTASENNMLGLLNQERTKKSLSKLTTNQALTQVSREHCQDMFMRGYFSHYSPDGSSPFDRMNRAGIDYRAAGENLAFAPSIEIAHKGLMESPGHRANILSSDYGRVGIGIIDAGVYGKMFCQEFTN